MRRQNWYKAEAGIDILHGDEDQPLPTLGGSDAEAIYPEDGCSVAKASDLAIGRLHGLALIVQRA